MRFDRHLFISYAHIDNQPLSPQQQGWITRFHATLAAQLSMRIGRQAEIWRDDKLRGNDIFADEIVEQFDRTAILISVLTPRYLASEWCTRELREFCTKAQQTGGVILDNQARVFKVLKAPIESQDALPAALRNALGYEFFSDEDGAPLELDPAYGEKYAQGYFRKVGILAWDAAQLLRRMENAARPAPGIATPPAAAKATVYLAECSRDRRDVREMLEADLKLHGYAVLPDRRLPLEDEAEYVAAVEHLLERCSLSIHLVGSAYGTVPDGSSQKSVTVLQNERAADRSKAGGLKRVIWLPQATQAAQPQQQVFITALHQDAEMQFGADLVTGDVEELKTAIHATLKQLDRAADTSAQARAGSGAKLVYLVCDERDRKSTIPLRKFLKERGVEVALPAFDGQAAAVREANQKLLGACDLVIVFYGAGDEPWKRSTDNELKKMKALRGGAALASRTYLAEPPTSDKHDLVDMDESGLIDGLNGFPEPTLTQLVVSLLAGDVR